LLILTEAGEKIGFGHISRCSAIHHFFKKQNVPIDLLLDWQGNQPCPYDFQLLGWRNEMDKLADYAGKFNKVLIDSYKTSLLDLKSIQKYFKSVIVLDDYKRLDFGVALVINPNIYGDSIDYSCKSVGGRDYVILREAFRNANEKASIKDSISSILVTVGGSDYQNLLPFFAESLKALPYQFNFLCANDRYANELSEKFKQQDNFTFCGILSEFQMKNVMLQSDLAISACGQSLHELAYLGVPTMGVLIGNDQTLNCESYFRNRFLIEKTESNFPELAKVLRSGIEKADKPTRFSSSENGKKMIDGKGLERIFTLISNESL